MSDDRRHQDEFKRRRTDNIVAKTKETILSLIEKTEDNNNKAFLLILLQMSDAIEHTTDAINENTIETKRTSDNLTTHITNFTNYTELQDQEANKNKGAWGVLEKAIPLLQIAILGAIGYFWNDMLSIHKDIYAMGTDIAVVKADLQTVKEKVFPLSIQDATVYHNSKK